MSEVLITSGRVGKTGRFVPGNKGNGGRPKGSRNKLGEAFLEDLRDAGANTARKPCERVRDPSPALSVRSAGLLPKSIDLNMAARYFRKYGRAGHGGRRPATETTAREAKGVGT
jgi:hypothetical protein